MQHENKINHFILGWDRDLPNRKIMEAINLGAIFSAIILEKLDISVEECELLRIENKYILSNGGLNGTYNDSFSRPIRKEEKYDRVTLMLPRGQKEIIRVNAISIGETANSFAKRAIRETMERDKEKAGG